MEVHWRVVEVKPLEVVKSCSDCVIRHRRLKPSAELSQVKLILPQEDALLVWIKVERLDLFVLQSGRKLSIQHVEL